MEIYENTLRGVATVSEILAMAGCRAPDHQRTVCAPPPAPAWFPSFPPIFTEKACV